MNFNIRAMVKNGYKTLKIDGPQLQELAIGIVKNGSVPVQTTNDFYEVVGFMVIGKETGERVIILSKEE